MPKPRSEGRIEHQIHHESGVNPRWKQTTKCVIWKLIASTSAFFDKCIEYFDHLEFVSLSEKGRSKGYQYILKLNDCRLMRFPPSNIKWSLKEAIVMYSTNSKMWLPNDPWKWNPPKCLYVWKRVVSDTYMHRNFLRN